MRLDKLTGLWILKRSEFKLTAKNIARITQLAVKLGLKSTK